MYANKDLKIDNEFEKLIPPLTKEEFQQLQTNCVEDGIREPIAIWNDLIIDGHNRFKISKDNGWLDFDTIDYTERLTDRGAVIEWMLNNQLGRRNLNPDQLSIIRGKLYNLYKLGHGGDRKSSHQNEDLKTSEKLSNQFKVSKATIERDGKFIEDYPDEAEKIYKGEKTKREVKNEIRKKEALRLLDHAKNGVFPTTITLYEGDLFQKASSIPDSSIDLLCTDPPYFVLNDSWDTFDNYDVFLQFTEDWLKIIIPKVKLKTGRIYISFAPDYKYGLYEVLKRNDFFGFNFGKEIIWYKKNDVKMFNRKSYRINYEPIFYLYGEDAGYLNFDDPYVQENFNIQSNVWEIATPQSNFKEGKLHPAQKPLELYRRIVLTGSNVGDTVLDCFAGSGTTGAICKETNRNCILIERDNNYIDLIKGRLSDII